MVASGKIERKKEPTFEEKYGVDAITLNDKYTELVEKSKSFSVYDAYRVLTNKDVLYEDHDDFSISFVNEINKHDIKLKKKVEVKNGILLFKPRLANPIKKTGIESLYDVTIKDDLKPNLSGVYVDGENIVATDGHALVVVKDSSYKKFNGKILNVKTGKEIDAKFPDYKSVIPYNFDQYTKFIPIDELISITNGFKESLKNIKLTPYIEDRAAIIINFNGRGMDLDFGIRYNHTLNALQALKANGAKAVRIGVNVPNKPMVIYSDNGNMALVMPLLIYDDNIIKTETIKFEVFGENESDPDPKKEDTLFSELESVAESFDDCLKRNGINLEKGNHKFEVGTIVSDNMAGIKLKVDSFNEDSILFDRIFAFKGVVKSEAYPPITYSQLIETFKTGGISVEGFEASEVMEFARILNTIQHCMKMDKLHEKLKNLPNGAVVGIELLPMNGFRSITEKNGTTIFEGFIENRYFKIQNDSNDWYVLDGTVEADEFKLWLDSKSLHEDDKVYKKWIDSLDSDFSQPDSKINSGEPIYLKEIIIKWQEGSNTVTDKSYTSIKDVEHQMGVTGSLEGKDVYYDKNKLIFIWEDGYTDETRIDVGLSKHDFNPRVQSLKDYEKKDLDELNERLGKNYVLDFKEGNEEKEREYLDKTKYKDITLKVGAKYIHKDLGKVTLKSIMVNEAPESETNPYDVRFEDENHKGVQSDVTTFYNSVQSNEDEFVRDRYTTHFGEKGYIVTDRETGDVVFTGRKRDGSDAKKWAYERNNKKTEVSDIKSTIEGLKVLLSIETDKVKKKEIKDVIAGLKLI